MWLSGAVPKPASGDGRPLDREVLDSVARLTSQIIKQGGNILHDGQAGFAAVLLEQARRARDTGLGRSRVALWVSKFWNDEPAPEIEEWKSLCHVIETKVGHGGDDKPALEPSLEILHSRMVKHAHAFIAVGASFRDDCPESTGLSRQLELARARGLPCFLIGFGAKPTDYLSEHPQALETLENGLTLEENQKLAACEDVRHTVAAVVSQLSALFGRANKDASAVPAHALYVELATRITTQRLHYRSGDEETAAQSVSKLFEITRQLMKAHPEAHEFHRVALALLNDSVRPYTARWHGWMTQDGDKVDQDGKPILKLRDEWVRRKFREELRELQPLLFGFQKTLQALSLGRRADPRWLNLALDPVLRRGFATECRPESGTAWLGDCLTMELRPQVTLRLAGAKGPDESTHAATAILNAENREIARRRAQMRLRDSSPKQIKEPVERRNDDDPLKKSDATSQSIFNASGLALSGGGIRSATFCLGIVQALHRHGLFTRFDYLSTVSGGGYLGSFLSSYLGTDSSHLDETEKRIAAKRNTPLTRHEEVEASAVPTGSDEEIAQRGEDAHSRIDEALREPDGGGSESLAIRHLRNNSRYLLNGGGWGLLRIASVFVTGFFTSLLVLLTVPLLAAWALLGIKQPEVAQFFEKNLWLLEPWRNWRFAVVTTGFAILGAVLALRSKKGDLLANSIMWLGAAGVVLWLVAGIRALGLNIVYWPDLGWSASWGYPAGISLVGVASSLIILWLLVPLTQRAAHGTRWDSFPTKMRSLLESAALVVSIVLMLNVAICAVFPLVRGYEQASGWVGKRIDQLLNWNPPELLGTALLSIIPAIFAGLTKRKDGSIRTWAQWLFYLTAPAFFLVAFLAFASNLGVGGESRTQAQLSLAAGLTVALFIWAFVFLNINTFAPHRYYRNRLCECYLAARGRQQRSWLRRTIDKLLHGVSDPGRTESFEGVGTLQRLPLTALSASTAAPYHLINTTLNVAASKNPSLRGRNGDFFFFSRHFCGSPLTGYMTTEDLEKVDPHVDLGTAMAISGAAASTNMGWQTLRRFRFLMTLFNVRLGYWMRRPGSTGWWRPFEGPGPLYFLREMLGAVHERTHYVNLSDGGHIENLAVYELLRRQCKFIVCVDAGMEPKMECADLMRLQRYATIDLGIRMHFDPTDLTLLPTTYSRAYAVLVKLDYAPEHAENGTETSDKLGWMLYLKLALTGTEPRYVLDYRRQNPAFPHQTTVDQFYDEAQFEAYRALGECAVESLFRDEIIDGQEPKTLCRWFQKLANNLLPDNDEAFTKAMAEQSEATGALQNQGRA